MLFQVFVVILGSCSLLFVITKRLGNGDSCCVWRCGHRRCYGRSHIVKDAEIQRNGRNVGMRSIFDGYLHVLKEERQLTFAYKQGNWDG